jgi:hypothetical protein
MKRQVAIWQPNEIAQMLLSATVKHPITVAHLPAVLDVADQLRQRKPPANDREVTRAVSLAMGSFKISPSVVINPEIYAEAMAKAFARYPALVLEPGIDEMVADPKHQWLPSIAEFCAKFDELLRRTWDTWRQIEMQVGGFNTLYMPYYNPNDVMGPPPPNVPLPKRTWEVGPPPPPDEDDEDK